MGPPVINIGILCEGEADLLVAKIFVTRILDTKSIGCVFDRTHCSRTGIERDVSVHAKVFFKSSKPVKIGIFLTDKDKSSGKKDRIISDIKQVAPLSVDFSVIGIPDPHIEAWLLADVSLVIKLFSISEKKEHLKCKLTPKNQLLKLRQSMPDPRMTLFEIYEHLAMNSNLKILQDKCQEFKKFNNELLTAANLFLKR